jgi:acetoacetyl-CoA synthetase
MAVESYDSSGNVNKPGEAGELVCVRPFPCMPVGFWPVDGFGDESSVSQAKERFRQSYFSHFKHIWCELPLTCR